MIHGFENYSGVIVPPDIVTNTPSIFHHMRPHSMPVYKEHSTLEWCVPYACKPYEKDQCYKFR